MGEFHFGFLSWLLLVLFLFPAPSRAYERQLQIGVHGGFADIQISGDNLNGGGVGLHMAYGIDDTWGVFVSSDVSFINPPPPPSEEEQAQAQEEGQELVWGEETIRVTSTVAGAMYALDIFRVVPYICLGVGPYWKRDEMEKTTLDLGFKLAVGADYLIFRWMSAGAEVAYHGLVTDFQNLPVYLTVFGRFTFLIDI